MLLDTLYWGGRWEHDVNGFVRPKNFMEIEREEEGGGDHPKGEVWGGIQYCLYFIICVTGVFSLSRNFTKQRVSFLIV